MPKEQTPLRPIRIDYKCDKCSRGYMRSTGMTLTSHPPQFPHLCDNCNASQTFMERYPYMHYSAEGDQINLDVPQGKTPAGYQLVPIEPTIEMIDAAITNSNYWPKGTTNFESCYRAMLAAALLKPVGKQKIAV